MDMLARFDIDAVESAPAIAIIDLFAVRRPKFMRGEAVARRIGFARAVTLYGPKTQIIAVFIVWNGIPFAGNDVGIVVVSAEGNVGVHGIDLTVVGGEGTIRPLGELTRFKIYGSNV